MAEPLPRADRRVYDLIGTKKSKTVVSISIVLAGQKTPDGRHASGPDRLSATFDGKANAFVHCGRDVINKHETIARAFVCGHLSDTMPAIVGYGEGIAAVAYERDGFDP